MTELTTKRLCLRAARDDERAALFNIYSNEQAMRYWDSPPHQSEGDTARTHEFLMQPGPRRYFLWDFSGDVIGAGGIHGEAELGFILHPDYWGKGFAREACTAIIDHMWASTDHPKLTAEADPRNLASVGLLTRLGFVVSGYARDTIFHLGEWTDSVYMTLARPDAKRRDQRPS